MKKKIADLEALLDRLKTKNLQEKNEILSVEPFVKAFLGENPFWQNLLATLSPLEQLIIKSILAIDQGQIVLQFPEDPKSLNEYLQALLCQLTEVEHFYDVLGGIIGYHLTVLRLIEEGEGSCFKDNEIRYLKPEGMNLIEETSEVRKAIVDGIKNLPGLAEIYPVGGAGDRLMLKDEETNELLPAACLQFCGRTLLENLIRDLQAREYLYFKLYHKQIVIPVAMMTSNEKRNHEHILAICEKHQWFGRPRQYFFIFKQPLVPVITKEGNWSCFAPMRVTMKPGGHGVIWKKAIDQGIFDQLEEKGSSYAIVRQLNNPIAAIDYGNLVLIGIGCREKKSFGFASCPRPVGASEGMNVLMERKVDDEYEYAITNIEYTEFVKKGIEDVPGRHPPYSIFPANTNILFANLKSVREAVKQCPFPGMLLNMKHKAHFLSSDGTMTEVLAGRLETTMQNLLFLDRFSHSISSEELQRLQTFITYNSRHKTISVTKKSYEPGSDMSETPEGCFYEFLLNHRDLLVNKCQMQLPELNSSDDYLQNGPSFVVQLHPALGPLYSIISQKIRGGSIAKDSELQLEVTEVDISNLQLNGSLEIFSNSPIGEKDAEGILKYSDKCGRCELHDVKIENLGIDKKAKSIYWKNQIVHKESCEIILQGSAEFYAHGVILRGNQKIIVPDNHRMSAYEEKGKVLFRLEKIEKPTWHWEYYLKENNTIQLIKNYI